PGEVVAHVLEVALQQVESAAVERQIDGLREVDDLHASFPVQDIERREVAVHEAARQEDLDIVQNALEERMRLTGPQFDAAELRGRSAGIANELQEDRAPGPVERPRNVSACRVQLAQRAVFCANPCLELHRATDPCLLLHRPAQAPVYPAPANADVAGPGVDALHHAPLLVYGVVLKAAVLPRPVDLGG